jgi:hypothetical protein
VSKAAAFARSPHQFEGFDRCVVVVEHLAFGSLETVLVAGSRWALQRLSLYFSAYASIIRSGSIVHAITGLAAIWACPRQTWRNERLVHRAQRSWSHPRVNSACFGDLSK